MREKGINLAADIIGSFLIAIGVACFAEGIHIAPGGVSGLALLIQQLWGFPIGVTALCLNLPLLLAARRIFGFAFLRRTLQTLLISTFMFDIVVSPFLPKYTGDRILGAVVAGLLSGTGLAIVFVRGSTTAGTDILSRIVAKRFPHIPIGLALLCVDGIVLGLSILVYRNWESGLLGCVAIFCQAKAIDGIIYGIERGNTVLIVSEKGTDIAARITRDVARGATLLEARGAYLGTQQTAVITVVRPSEFHHLKELISQCDPKAFVVVIEARQIYGEGFRCTQA